MGSAWARHAICESALSVSRRQCDEGQVKAVITIYLFSKITEVHKFSKKQDSLQNLKARGMKRIKFHTEDPQILDANVQNLVAWMI